MIRARSARALALALVLGGSLSGCTGCSHRDDGTAPSAASEPLPEFVLREDTPNVLLTWLDARGVGHTELRPRDVPPAARSLVRVVVSDREDGTRERFYVVDLNAARPDGGYLAKTMTRRAWEDEIDKRRGGSGEGLPPVASAAPGPSGSAGGPRVDGAAKVIVVIYGAQWCHPCHQAAAWLKARGIPYVMKDIEADATADQEMQGKLEGAGRRGGSIPVIDVGGQILVGFSEDELARALKRASAGTVL